MDDIQNLFKETIAEFMENGLDAELDEELGYSKYDYRAKDTDNSRNGHSSKTLRTSFGEVPIAVPRDRKGEFEPQLLKKNQTSISHDIEEKILSMYAKGMTTGDIEAHIRDIYGIEVSDTTVSRITDKILPIAREWQQRPLESVYAVSNVMSFRLSSRPMAWSTGTLCRLALLLAKQATNKHLSLINARQGTILTSLATATTAAGKAVARGARPRYSAGLLAGEAIGNITVLENGKRTSLYHTLRNISSGM